MFQEADEAELKASSSWKPLWGGQSILPFSHCLAFPQVFEFQLSLDVSKTVPFKPVLQGSLGCPVNS